MHFATLSFVLAFAPTDAPTAVVVATEPDAALQQRMLHIKDWSSAVGVTVIDTTDLERRLTGQRNPQIVDLSEMKKRITDAADKEARYDAAAALKLRQEVIRAYDSSVLPSAELQTLAARALQDIAAAELADGHAGEAQDAARTAQRRFPGVPLDTTRHSPQVEQLFKRAAADLKRAPTTDVTIITNKPGKVMADNVAIGAADKTMTRKLPQGVWLVWISDANGTSLAHAVTVASAPVTVDIDFALESALSWTPVPTLRCAPSCDTMLRQLATRVAVSQAVGLKLDPENERAAAIGTFVKADNGTVESKPVLVLADLSVPPAYLSADVAPPPGPSRFSPWSLVPFGVGQFAQHRYVAGSIYAGIQAGLLAWNIVAGSQHSSFSGADSSKEESQRTQQNVSGGLFVGAMIANVAEAIVWGAMHPRSVDGYAPAEDELVGDAGE